jgi:glycosyltransferase involved in cell wall biosynthesis
MPQSAITGSRAAVRVLYSFPHRLGAGRICDTAWHQIAGASGAGAQMLAVAGAVQRALPPQVELRTTLSRGRLRVPYRVLGQLRALRVHDRLVAHRLTGVADSIDVVHVWPLGALHTLRAARRLGIPTVLERPNAHTRFAYEIVQNECERLGVPLPRDHEHAFNDEVLRIEEEEYDLADQLLCPSDFVLATFRSAGHGAEKLVRHRYGYDESVFFSAPKPERTEGLRMLFVGVAAVRKGLHFALEAWVRSPASANGTFMIAGSILPAYRDYLAPLLEHPSVQTLGHRSDIPELMRASDVLVLPSLEEGSALVCAEAIGSGCVPLVSDATSGVCEHSVNALVHRAGDVETLLEHITAVAVDRDLLARLRANGLKNASSITWGAAGARLYSIYRDIATSRGDKAHGARAESTATV